MKQVQVRANTGNLLSLAPRATERAKELADKHHRATISAEEKGKHFTHYSPLFCQVLTRENWIIQLTVFPGSLGKYNAIAVS